MRAHYVRSDGWHSQRIGDAVTGIVLDWSIGQHASRIESALTDQNDRERMERLDDRLERDGSISVVEENDEPRVFEVSVANGVPTVRIALE